MGDDGCLYDCESEAEFDEKVEAFKQKWDEIEIHSTKNNPPKFTKYFVKHKQAQIRDKMAKYVRERAGVPRGFGQNPIEWLHYMSKTEIDDVGRVKHRETNLTTALQSLKGRFLRLYKDAVKAIYGEGPYRLDNTYMKFNIEYDDWMGRSREDRQALVKRFFTATCTLPRPPHDERRISKVTQQVPKRLSVAVDDFNIPEHCIPASTLRNMHAHAEALLNEPGAIMQAASNDPRVRTVRSRTGPVPLVVKPLKTGHQLECNCTTYKSLSVCQDTIAVAEDLHCLTEYIEGLRKKLQRKKAGPKGVNLTAAYNSRRTLSEQGLKQNEVGKAAHRRKHTQVESWTPNTISVPNKAPSTASITSTPAPGLQQQNPTLTHFSATPAPSLSQLQGFANPHQQQRPYQVPHMSQQSGASLWHSGLSPYRYELSPMQNSINKCYGCNQDFAEKYRIHPYDIIVRHVDRRIRGLGADGTIQYGVDFANTYYHCDINHIRKKKPYFDGMVYASSQLPLSPEQQFVIMTGGLTVRFIPLLFFVVANGPQFSCAEFQEFAKKYEFKHITSSPRYPQSNGLVERTVQTVKHILKKAKHDQADPNLALLDLRNTPIDGIGLSPTQMLMGRGTRTRLPTDSKLLKPLFNSADIKPALEKIQAKQKLYYDKSAKPLEPLKKGDRVGTRNEAKGTWIPATVKKVNDQP
ncbi:hypothetical protein QZH41_010212 [Actinostola sp. cb2023]|nr:hypothetical protein QZH41_010212 [Actinostola sp. cb2023]